nr:YfhO family protein [Lachnospiraceae bacterium]
GMARNDRMPFIYSSVLVLLCVVFYFLTGSFKLRDKISTLFLMAALILSMYLNPLDAVWHGFNNPVGFPWRYSYFLTLLMILTGYRFFSEFTKKSEELLIKGKTFLAAALIFLLYFVFLLVTVNPYFDKERAILNILLTFVYILLFFMLLKREALEKRIRHSSRLFIPLIFILLFGELTYNSCISFYSLNGDGEELSVFNEKYDEIKASVDYIKSRDDSLYRLEKDFYRTPNDPMMFDYIGLTHSSSCEKEYIRHFLSRWGFRDTGLYAFYNLGSTSFADSFLGVKYYISRFDQIHKPYYYLDQCENHFAYLNPYALGFMSLAPKALEEVDLNSGNTFELQNNIANAYGKYDIYQKADYEIELENVTMTEEKGLLKFNVNSEEASFNSEGPENTESLVHFNIDIKKEGSLYYFFDAPQMQAAEVFVNGDYREPYFTTTNWSVLCAGIYKPGDKVDVCLKLNEEAISISQACFYYEDTKALSSWYEKASEGNAELKEITSSHLKGSIRASKDDIILFSIPYEEAWNIKINGKKGEKIPLLKELLAVKVPDSGELVIEMQYIPSGLLPGIIISILGIALLLLLWIREKNN